MGLFKAIGGLVKKVAGPALSAVPGVGPIASLALSAGSAYLGNKMDAARDRGALRDKYDFMESKGLTPQEIAGASFGANPSSSAANVLGNQAAQQAQLQRQLDFQQAERDKDRALQVRAQDMGLRQTQVSAGAQMYGADVNARTAANALALQRDRYDTIDLPNALLSQQTSTPEFVKALKQMSMGLENVQVEALLTRNGISLSDPNSIRDMSPEAFSSLQRQILSLSSQSRRETAGAADALSEALSGFGMGAASVVGNQGAGSSGRRDRR